MFVSELKFQKTLEWFHFSKYDYMLLFVSSFDINEERYIEEIIRERVRINQLTGDDTCFLIFSKEIIICSEKQNDQINELLFSHIKEVRDIDFSKYSSMGGYALEASIAISSDVCSKLNIRLSKLPAFILIDKKNTYSLFSTSNPTDLEKILSPLQILGIFSNELFTTTREIDQINREIDQHPLIEKKLHNLKLEILQLEKIIKERLEVDFLNILESEYTSQMECLMIFFKECEVNIFKDYPNLLSNIYSLKRNIIRITKRGYPQLSSQIEDIFTNRKFNDTLRKLRYLKKNIDYPENLNLSLKIKNINFKIAAYEKTYQPYANLLEQKNNKLNEFRLFKSQSLEKLSRISQLNNNVCEDLIDCIYTRKSPIPLLFQKLNSLEFGSHMHSFSKKEKKFDVFISSKSQDYSYAHRIYKFLTAHGLNVFIATESIRRFGRSDYSETISHSIDISKHLIVLGSRYEYFLSPYVKKEWRLFISEKSSGRKLGNLIPITIGNIDTAELDIELRNLHILKYENFEMELLDFVKTNTGSDV